MPIPSGEKEDKSPFAVADYVQLAGMSGRSVVLEIQGPGTVRGTIVIRSGLLWSARDEQDAGFGAFRRLVFLRDAMVRCVTLETHGVSEPRMFKVSCETALLNAAQLNDEEKAGVQQGTSSPGPALSSAERMSIASGHPPAAPVKLAVVPALPSSPPRPARQPPPPPPAALELGVSKTFEQLYDEGIEAILSKRFDDAFRAFRGADAVRPGDSRVRANLERLTQMGYKP